MTFIGGVAKRAPMTWSSLASLWGIGPMRGYGKWAVERKSESADDGPCRPIKSRRLAGARRGSVDAWPRQTIGGRRVMRPRRPPPRCAYGFLTQHVDGHLLYRRRTMSRRSARKSRNAWGDEGAETAVLHIGGKEYPTDIWGITREEGSKREVYNLHPLSSWPPLRPAIQESLARYRSPLGPWPGPSPAMTNETVVDVDVNGRSLRFIDKNAIYVSFIAGRISSTFAMTGAVPSPSDGRITTSPIHRLRSALRWCPVPASSHADASAGERSDSYDQRKVYAIALADCRESAPRYSWSCRSGRRKTRLCF